MLASLLNTFHSFQSFNELRIATRGRVLSQLLLHDLKRFGVFPAPHRFVSRGFRLLCFFTGLSLLGLALLLLLLFELLELPGHILLVVLGVRVLWGELDRALIALKGL